MHGTVIFSLSHTFFLWKMKTTICLMGSQHIILCSRLKWWTAKVLSCVDHPPLLEFFKGVFYVFMPVSCSVISTIAEQVYITLMSPLKVKTSNARGQYQIIKTNGTMPESCCLAFPLLNNNKKKPKKQFGISFLPQRAKATEGRRISASGNPQWRLKKIPNSISIRRDMRIK